MKVTDAIKRMDGLITPYWCDVCIRFINSQKLKDLTVVGNGNGKIQKDVRNVKGFTVGNRDLFEETSDRQAKMEQVSKILYFRFVNKLLKIPFLNYSMMFKDMPQYKLLQIDFLKYGINGKYEVHSDAGDGGTMERHQTVIINLNGGYEGGDFNFYNPCNKKDIVHTEKLNKGSVMFFPSNYMYPHSVQPITKGERYSLVCWLG